METDTLSFLSDAGKHLLEASSIMQLIATNIASGNWKRTFNPRMPNPPEVSEHVCACLASLFKANAQSMAFVKALNSGSTSPATIKSRLSVGVVNSYSTAITHLLAAVAADLTPGGSSLMTDLLTFIHTSKQLHIAAAYQYAAQAYLEKTEVGNAIAFCNTAKVVSFSLDTLSPIIYINGF